MITVGVAAFNAASTLPRLLDSLLVQRYPPERFEIVVADNGSTDETPLLVRQYAERGPVRLVEAHQRRGPAVARNAVVATAAGEVIAFTDADCLADPDWLAQIAAGFDDPAVGCVAGAILPAEPQTAVEHFYARRDILSQKFVLAHPVLPYAQTANAAFRQEVFRRVGLFDETMITCEDADLLWRMQLQTDYQLHYQPTALVWHQHRSSPRALLKQTTGWGIGQALLYRKYQRLMPRDSWPKLAADYWRLGRFAGLALRRWALVRLGRAPTAPFEDAFFTLLFDAGIKLGRLRGSFRAKVFYP